MTDRADGRSAAIDRVHDLLAEHGATEDEIARAERQDQLDLLVVDRLFVPNHRRYNESQVSDITGMPTELARRFWRALGFPDASPDEEIFTDLDIEAISILEAMIDLGAADVETALQLARVMGSSMARIAESQISPAARFFDGAELDSVDAADRFARIAERVFPAMSKLLEFTWRRHVQAAVRRTMLLRARPGDGGALPELAVGFADMVGFTMLSQQLSEEELAAVVSRFEEIAHDITTSLGGRVVKMIGDEAMFVSESVEAMARIGLGLAEAYADDELLSDVRVALAVGPVLVQDGDYYGTVVNLASRVVNIAAPGSVLVSDQFHDALVDELERAGVKPPARPPDLAEGAEQDGDGSEVVSDEFAFKALRPRQVKDLGRVQLWVLFRPGAEAATFDRRLGWRWERLSEVLHDLDDLRERGERMVAVGLKATVAESADAATAMMRSEARKSQRGDAEAAQLKVPLDRGQGTTGQVDDPS